MNDALETMYGELSDLLEAAQNYQAADEEYAKIMDEANKLADRIIKMESIRKDVRLEELRQDGEIAKLENDLKIEEIKQSIPACKMGLELIKVFGPLFVESILYVWGIGKMGRFEETGRYTTAFSRIIQQRFPRFWK